MQSERADGQLESEIDLSALAWVQDELRRSLEASHKALRRFVKEYQTVFDSDVDAVDPTVLRGARQQLHQSVGALELVGLPAAARVLRATESVVQRFIAKPQRISEQLVDAIERASFALLDYVGRMLAGKSVSSLSLFPQYRAVQEVAGVERVHPADLWSGDVALASNLPADATASPQVADRLAQQRPRAATAQADAQLRRRRGSVRLSSASAISAPASAQARRIRRRPCRGSWPPRCSRLRRRDCCNSTSSPSASRRACCPSSACSRAGSPTSRSAWCTNCCSSAPRPTRPAPGRDAPRLAAVRQAYHLARHTPADYDKSVLGRFDPALIAQARKRVGGAKEAWGAVAGGEMHRLGRARRAVLARRRFAAPPLSRRASSSPTSCRPPSPRPSKRLPRRRRRWRWKSPPACSTSTPRSRTPTSTTRSSASACCAWPSASPRCAPGSRRRRSKPGWRSCTVASPTARRSAAWCTSCARRCPSQRS